MLALSLSLSLALIGGLAPDSRAGDLDGRPIAEQKITEKDVVGDYSCTFTQGEYSYPPFRCVIRRVQGRLELEKLTGSQRIKGPVKLDANGFHFEGVFFCPSGSCTQKVQGAFARLSAGVFEGTLDDSPEPTVVRLTRRSGK